MLNGKAQSVTAERVHIPQVLKSVGLRIKDADTLSR